MKKIDQLYSYLKKLAPEGIALAFSGGVDSSLLLEVLRRMRMESDFPLIAMTMHSVFQREEELEEVKSATATAGIDLLLFECDPLAIPEIRTNTLERCYHCKRNVFTTILELASANGLKYVLDGSNADDLNVYRPGRTALQELGVCSPLADLGFSKPEIREIAARYHLPSSGKPSMPCMATRFEYGTTLTPDLIRRTAEGEDLIRSFLPDCEQLRLRVHGASLARIEVSELHLPDLLKYRFEIVRGLKELGFSPVSMDLEGFRSGGMDPKQSPKRRRS